MTEREVRHHLKRLCESVTATSVAKSVGVTPEFLSLVIHGKRRPSKKVLDYLGLHRVVEVSYHRKG